MAEKKSKTPIYTWLLLGGVSLVIVVVLILLVVWLVNDDSGSSDDSTTTDSGSGVSGDTGGSSGNGCSDYSAPTSDNPTVGFSEVPYEAAIPKRDDCQIPLDPDDTSAFVELFKADGIVRNGNAPLGWAVTNNTGSLCTLYAQFFSLTSGYLNLTMNVQTSDTTFGWSDVEIPYGFLPTQSFFVRLQNPSNFNPIYINLGSDIDGNCILTPEIDSGLFHIIIDINDETQAPYLTVEVCD